MMQSLNLPEFEPKIIKESGKYRIFDLIRKKYVVLTPEEWVRQHFINYMLKALNYPKSLIKVESGLKLNALQKRSDILIHDREGKAWMLVECKAPEIALDQKAFNQATIYNMTIRARFIVVTNGMLHYCFKPFPGDQTPEFLNGLPAFDQKV